MPGSKRRRCHPPMRRVGGVVSPLAFVIPPMRKMLLSMIGGLNIEGTSTASRPGLLYKVRRIVSCILKSSIREFLSIRLDEPLLHLKNRKSRQIRQWKKKIANERLCGFAANHRIVPDPPRAESVLASIFLDMISGRSRTKGDTMPALTR